MANIKENKRFHFTYKTINLINNRYYLGMHSTNRIDDGYLGSGKRLYYELNKYGRDSFTFEILEQFTSREELVQAEISLITEQDLKNPNCLNLKLGGSGGFAEEVGKAGRLAGNAEYVRLMREDPIFRARMVEMHQVCMEKQYREGTRLKVFNYDWKGKSHTPDTIQKQKQVKVGHGKGQLNSQYGTCWITNEVESIKINKGDTIPEGWRLGRKVLKK